MAQENKNTNTFMDMFEGGGQMGDLMRSYNWTKHPLGVPDKWPHSLKTTLRLILNSGYPMFLWWTGELYMFHNDPYLPALGKKHPKALGASAKVMWSEIWDQVGEIVNDILNGGKPFYAENLLIPLERKGFLEETYWTFSYSAAYDDEGNVGGIFCACNEVTNSVLGDRRIKAIKEISQESIQIQTVRQACEMASKVIAQNRLDIPFSLIYLLNADKTEAKLCSPTGPLSTKALAGSIKFESKVAKIWPLEKVYKSKTFYIFEPDPQLFSGEEVTKTKKAVVFPIFKSGEDQVIGFLISGISLQLEYDENYQGFHHLLCGQIASTISSVQSRQHLANQRAFLKEVFQQAPVAISILEGPDHIVDLANQKICDLWGRSPADVLNKPISKALPEVKNQGIIQLLDKVYRSGVPYVANEYQFSLEREGKMVNDYFNFVYQPFKDINGRVIGVIVVAVSVKEQVEVRHEIEAKNKELLTINSDLDNFVYSASHDLKAPISNIEGLTQALVKLLPVEVIETEKIKVVMQLVLKSIERFKKTVDDLSEITKMQRDSGQDVVAINLKDIVEEVQLDLAPIIDEAEVTIKKDYTGSPEIRFSPKNARSIAYNLLSNAIKYRSTERKPHINITIFTVPGYVVFSVADNGLGIDLNQKDKIFSMFQRLHDHVEGSGVGLYIVKKIIENAGGKIELESKVGIGSTFRVYFRI